MRNRKRRKAKHRCQKATKQVKGQTDRRGGGDKGSNALNIQMFIDASVRNGFDTLKTILKLFLFKIYTWVRRLSGAVGTAAIQCGVNITLTFSPEVLLVHKSDGTRFGFPEQKDCPHQLHHHHHHYHRAEPLDSHTEVSFSQGAFRSTVQSSLVCTNTQSVRSGGQKHSDAWRCFIQPPLKRSRESICVTKLSFSTQAQFDPLLYSLIGSFSMEFIFY